MQLFHEKTDGVEMRNLLLLLLICIPFSAQGFFQDISAPFGFHRGMTQDEIIALVGKEMVSSINGDNLVLNPAPKPHPNFEGYTLTISPDKGLLGVMAFAKKVGADGVRD